MRDPFRDFAFFHQVNQNGRHPAVFLNEADLVFCRFDTSADIFADRFIKIEEPRRGVVEIGNGLVETFPRKVCQQHLEIAERLCRLICLFFRFKRIVGAGVVDEFVGAPAFVSVNIIHFSVHCGDKMDAAPFGVRQ